MARNNSAVVIGVGGVTNGGKTTLAAKLKAKFQAVQVLNMDHYYWDEFSGNHTLLEQFDDYANWDVASAVDFDRLTRDVENWIKSTSNEKSSDSENPPLLLVEGILIFNHRPLLPFFSKKYFFTLDKEECWTRRKKRTYLPPEPEGYFEAIAWPCYLANKKEVQEQSDIVYLSGEDDEDTIFNRVLRDINQLLPTS